MSNSSPRFHLLRVGSVLAVAAFVCLSLATAPPTLAVEDASFAAVELVEEFQAPGRMEELSGVYPHPQSDLYYVVANQSPVLRNGVETKLPEKYRGKLLTVNRAGEVLAARELVAGDYGGLAFGDGHLFVASLDPAEILKIEPETGNVVARFPIAGPSGGLEYDAERDVLYAQLFVGYPHLAVIDAKTGAAVETLWSDESAMGLAKVKGDLLCTWSNGFSDDAFGELRLLDQESGHVIARQALDRVHTSLAPTTDGFLSLVSTGDGSGNVVVRRYAYSPVAR